MDEHCPKREYSISYDKIIRDPWITKGLSNSICKQKKLYLKQLHFSDPDCTNKYISYRNVLKKLLIHSKLDYFNNKCLEYKENSRKLWQLINQVIHKISRKSQVIESLRIDNLVRYSPMEITKGFCDHFATVGKTYSDKVQPPRVLVETYNEKIDMSNISMFLSPTDSEEIKALIMNLPAKNSSGCDDISNNLLKKLCSSLFSPLEMIFNKSLNEGVFPELMKLADICPLFKSKLENDANNYRPISLLMTISKVLEKIVYQRTYSFMESTGQIYNSQYGFRSQHSCENTDAELTSEIVKGLQNGMYTVALFLDLSKALDTLEHEVLLDKMYRYGIRGTSLNWFKSYLENRKIRVKCQVASSRKLEYSDYQIVNYGTPQGSCLGPLIFLIFTNDLHQHLNHCASILFADDTTLYKTHRNLNYLKWCIQDDMQTLADWFKANKLTLNLEKTICLLFQQSGSCKELELVVDNVTIRTSKETKFLGMWLDQHLTWSTHIQKLVTKLKRNINLLKHGNRLMTTDCKRLVYFAHIQSHLQYGILLWGSSLTLQEINRLTKIQISCLRYRASFLNKGSQSLLTIKPEIKDKPNLKSFSYALKEHFLSQY